MPSSSVVDVIPSLDLSAAVDPVIVSANPEIRRTSTRAFLVRDATPDDFLIVDTTNRRLGVEGIDGQGSAFAPGFPLHAEYQSMTPIWVVDLYGTSSENFEFVGRKAEGTKAAPTALVDDDDMWEFSARGHDGVAFSDQQAVLLFEAAGAWTAASHGTRQVFKTTPQGSTVQVEVLVLGDDGCVIVTGSTNGLVGAVAGEDFRCNAASRFNGNMDLQGDFVMAPVLDNDWEIGTDARRFERVRAVSIVSGDLGFENGWKVVEDYEDEGLVFKDTFGREVFAVRKSGLYFMGKRIAGAGKELAAA